MVTAFQRGCVRPAQACHVAGSAGRSLAGVWGSQGAADPRQLLIPLAASHRAGPGSASQLSQPRNCQAEDRKPAWLLALGPGNCGRRAQAPLEATFSVKTPGTVCLATETQACGISQRLSGGREGPCLPGTIGLASDPETPSLGLPEGQQVRAGGSKFLTRNVDH